MMSYLTDGLIVSLLIMAILFCWRLNRRLQHMREMSEDLSPFMKNLAIYVTNISTSIDKLKQVAQIGEQSLSTHIPKATLLKDDFDILLEHSEKIANRLDEVIEKARQMDHQLHHTLQIAIARQKTIDQQKNEHIAKIQTTIHTPATEKMHYRNTRTEQGYPHQEDFHTLNYDENNHDEDFLSHHFNHTTENPITPPQQPLSRAIPITERGIMAKLKGIR